MDINPRGIRGLYESYLVKPEPRIRNLEEAIKEDGSVSTLHLEKSLCRIDLASELPMNQHALCIIGDYPARIGNLEDIRDSLYSAYAITEKRHDGASLIVKPIATIGRQRLRFSNDADEMQGEAYSGRTDVLNEVSHVERSVGFIYCLSEHGCAQAMRTLKNRDIRSFNKAYPFGLLKQTLPGGHDLILQQLEDFRGYSQSFLQGWILSIDNTLIRKSEIEEKAIDSFLSDQCRQDRVFIANHLKCNRFLPVLESERQAQEWAGKQYAKAELLAQYLAKEMFQRTQFLGIPAEQMCRTGHYGIIGRSWIKACN